MSHRADESFFEAKKPWSIRKDLILEYYLAAYLPKIATQGRSILLVDGFAGPGRFQSGEDGSPLIFWNAMTTARKHALPQRVELLCIERSESLHTSLSKLMHDKDGVVTHHAEFLKLVPEIERRAQNESVFLYVDPYAIKGLDWRAMDGIFSFVQRRQSVEVLFNFNAVAFVRAARAAMGLAPAEGDERDGTDEDMADISALDRAVGGDWYRGLISDAGEFAREVDAVTAGVCERLRKRFREVCRHDIHKRAHHSVPKYSLLFGSRHPDALLHMNDGMIKSRNVLAAEAVPVEPTLFETRSESLVPDAQRLPRLILGQLDQAMTRKDLVTRTIRANFGQFSGSEIRRAIGDLLRLGRVESITGKKSLNDKDMIRLAGPRQRDIDQP